MISLKGVEYSFIAALIALVLIFLEAIIGCQQCSGAKVQGLVLASLPVTIRARGNS